MTIESVCAVLESLGAPYALIGAHAMAARGYPRFTVDVDLLTSESGVLEPEVWGELEAGGAAVQVRRGDADDPLAGVVHVELAEHLDVDVIVGRWQWEADVIGRAERMKVMGTLLPVVRTSDLILLKLAAGGYLDLRDAAALLELGDRAALARAVDAHIDEVRPDVRQAWRSLLAASSDEHPG